MKAEQREGLEYEFGIVLDIIHDGHFATASKDRTGLFVDKDPKPITAETGRMLRDWLESGAEPAPEPTPDSLDYKDMIENAGTITELTSIWQMMTADEKEHYKPLFSEQKKLLTTANEAA